jgi:hypothetical protein
MWTILGYPPCGIAVPMFVAAGNDQPDYMLKGSGKGNNALMCDQTLARRARIFPLTRGNGKNYFNIGLAHYYMSTFFSVEDEVFFKTEQKMKEMYKNGKFEKSGLSDIYDLIGHLGQ